MTTNAHNDYASNPYSMTDYSYVDSYTLIPIFVIYLFIYLFIFIWLK